MGGVRGWVWVGCVGGYIGGVRGCNEAVRQSGTTKYDKTVRRSGTTKRYDEVRQSGKTKKSSGPQQQSHCCPDEPFFNATATRTRSRSPSVNTCPGFN